MSLARRPGSLWLADALVVVAIAGWAWGARSLPEFVLPGPVAVGERLLVLFTDPDFLVHTVASTVRVIASVVIALLLGGGLALLARAVPVLDGLISGLLQPFLNAFPSIGWAILAAIWFAPGHLSIVFVQVAILVPFCLINVAEGLRQVDREMIEMARSFTRRRPRVLAAVTVPLLLPYVIGALRIAYGVAWKIALVAELLGSTSGLGFLMLRAQGSADITTVLAACLAIVALFYAGERLLLDPLARRFAAR
ncbi:MAG: ABC transporter permease subunit [Burkholderiales bacterium]|nr:MAG: ABC transporter permease subunit [Burkholderiales bacterium]